MRRLIWLLLALALLAGPGIVPAAAQAPTPNEINAVAKELWCPLCNGVRLDNCELQACVQMKEVIAQKLAAGEDTEQIKAYFVQQYGDVVLGAPSREGFNLVAWLFPILAAVVGVAWLAYLIVAWRRRRPAAQAAPSTADRAQAAGDDDYLRRVDQELRRNE